MNLDVFMKVFCRYERVSRLSLLMVCPTDGFQTCLARFLNCISQLLAINLIYIDVLMCIHVSMYTRTRTCAHTHTNKIVYVYIAY